MVQSLFGAHGAEGPDGEKREAEVESLLTTLGLSWTEHSAPPPDFVLEGLVEDGTLTPEQIEAKWGTQQVSSGVGIPGTPTTSGVEFRLEHPDLCVARPRLVWTVLTRPRAQVGLSLILRGMREAVLQAQPLQRASFLGLVVSKFQERAQKGAAAATALHHATPAPLPDRPAGNPLETQLWELHALSWLIFPGLDLILAALGVDNKTGAFDGAALADAETVMKPTAGGERELDIKWSECPSGVTRVPRLQKALRDRAARSDLSMGALGHLMRDPFLRRGIREWLAMTCREEDEENLAVTWAATPEAPGEEEAGIPAAEVKAALVIWCQSLALLVLSVTAVFLAEARQLVDQAEWRAPNDAKAPGEGEGEAFLSNPEVALPSRLDCLATLVGMQDGLLVRAAEVDEGDATVYQVRGGRGDCGLSPGWSGLLFWHPKIGRGVLACTKALQLFPYNLVMSVLILPAATTTYSRILMLTMTWIPPGASPGLRPGERARGRPLQGRGQGRVGGAAPGRS
jgi:hypothetical protein